MSWYSIISLVYCFCGVSTQLYFFLFLLGLATCVLPGHLICFLSFLLLLWSYWMLTHKRYHIKPILQQVCTHYDSLLERALSGIWSLIYSYKITSYLMLNSQSEHSYTNKYKFVISYSIRDDITVSLVNNFLIRSGNYFNVKRLSKLFTKF